MRSSQGAGYKDNYQVVVTRGAQLHAKTTVGDEIPTTVWSVGESARVCESPRSAFETLFEATKYITSTNLRLR